MSSPAFPKWSRPLLFAALACGGTALFCFGQADRVELPFDPGEVRSVEAKVAGVRRVSETAFNDRQRKFRAADIWLMSLAEFPGVEFAVEPAPGVAELRDASVRLDVAGDPVAARDKARTTPNFTSRLSVVGVAAGGRTLIDYRETLSRAFEARSRLRRLGYGFAGAALIAALALGWRMRRVIADKARNIGERTG